LYNIEINIQNITQKKFNVKKAFDLIYPITYEELINNKLSNFSLEKISEIAKANNITKIDAFLSEVEIEKIVAQKRIIENSKKGGTIKYILRTNSGILSINLRILSPAEKLIIFLRIIGFLLAISGLYYYCFIFTQSYFIFVIGLIVSSFLITPIQMDIVNLFKDILKPSKSGRQQ